MRVVEYIRTKCPECGWMLSRIVRTWHNDSGRCTMRYHICYGCDVQYTSREENGQTQKSRGSNESGRG